MLRQSLKDKLMFSKKLRTLRRVWQSRGVSGIAATLGEKQSDARQKVFWTWREFIHLSIRSRIVPFKISHLHGPLEIKYEADELLLICVVRNGAMHISSFMRHYQNLGVKHFVFLDNDSTDNTVERLSRYENVTVLRSSCPYKKYENAMKTYLAHRFSRHRWNLCADIDELFDYPYSEQLSLRNLLRYLNENRYTAVVTQMLDMFSAEPLAKIKSDPNDELKVKYPFCDLSNIKKTDYRDGEISNPDIKYYQGGIRDTLFGSNNGLTKAALVFVDERIKLFVRWHQTANSRVADFSTVLYHFPFISTFYEKVRESVVSGRYGYLVTDEYAKYFAGMKNDPDLSLKLETAEKFASTDKLIEEDFLIVSEKYQQWAALNSHHKK